MHLKTDNDGLYAWALESLGENPGITLLAHTNDLYHSHLLDETTAIQTTYEKAYLAEGKAIKYISLV